MNDNLSSSASTSPAPTSPACQSLPWLLIIGLASLALLWPLTALWGLGQGAPRALTLLGFTAAVWISVVGIGRIRRPVLTLMVTAVLHGLVGLALGGVLAGSGPVGDPAALWLLIPALAIDAGAGALLGLVALAVQTALGPRTGGSGQPGAES